MIVARSEGGGAAVDFDGHVCAAKRLAQRVARLLDFHELDCRLAAIRQAHFHRFAAIEIDGGKERFLRFIGPNQNRGDQERERHGVASPIWRVVYQKFPFVWATPAASRASTLRCRPSITGSQTRLREWSLLH